MKLLWFEWSCGCQDRIDESGTDNPLRYWLLFWPLHHGPVRYAWCLLRALAGGGWCGRLWWHE